MRYGGRVPTHSRLKAAGTQWALVACILTFQHTAARRRLVAATSSASDECRSFNTQPPEGGWLWLLSREKQLPLVSTHSRPKAAGFPLFFRRPTNSCFNTQPPEGGWGWINWYSDGLSGFQHTAARRRLVFGIIFYSWTTKFQHTAARRRLVRTWVRMNGYDKFQHTAARRRLADYKNIARGNGGVSTHSRPKAAG